MVNADRTHHDRQPSKHGNSGSIRVLVGQFGMIHHAQTAIPANKVTRQKNGQSRNRHTIQK